MHEFSLEDATPLQEGLEQVCPGEGKRILERIFYWTSGYPYLTQKICKTIAETGRTDWSNAEVDNLVHRLFLADEARKETNLKDIQDGILDNDQFDQMLKLYKRVRRTRVKENPQSILQNQLMLSGLLTSKGEYLEIRNRIYRTVFDDAWINRNTPRNWQRYAIVGLGIMVVLLASVIIHDATLPSRLGHYETVFRNTTNPEEKLSILADIYRSKAVLSNTNTSSSTALRLFYKTLERQDQLNLFSSSHINLEDPKVRDDLVTVISNLYSTIAYVNPDTDNTELLRAMTESLDKTKDIRGDAYLRIEIRFWLAGRQAYLHQDYTSALYMYNGAIESPPKNPATLYERSLVYIALANEQALKQESQQAASENYANALRDLDTTLGLAQAAVKATPTSLSPSTMASLETATIQVREGPVGTLLFVPSTPGPHSLLPTATSAPETSKFESKFSTFDQIFSAVQALINENPGLQAAIQPNGNVTYTNLQSVGLVRIYPTPTSVLSSDRAGFVADMTVPDGTSFDPGASFKKTWRLRNIGTSTWTTSYSLVFDSGTQMSAEASYAFPAEVAPGKTVDVTVELTAPRVPGHYYGYWKLKNAAGVLFGIGFNANRSWSVEINVNGSSTGGVVYEFATDANAKSATWSSGAGGLTFPGTDGDAKGFALRQEQPKYESGVTDSKAGLLVSPQQITNGYIQAVYPEFTVQNGDRLQTTVGCELNATSCYVAYRLDYQIDTGPVHSFWTFRENFDGFTYPANLNLSPLAGQNVKFILYVSAWGSPVGDRAIWGNPVITRPGAGTTPQPTVTGTPPTPTPTSTGGPPTVPPSSCDRAQFIAEVTVPDGTVMAPGQTFTKTWRLKNVGTCSWSSSYQLVFSSGEQMGAPASTNFPLASGQVVAPGQTVDVSVNMTAPSTAGSYRGFWMFKNASGQLFGTGSQANRPWWVDIKVAGPAVTPGGQTPTPIPGAGSSHLTPTPK